MADTVVSAIPQPPSSAAATMPASNDDSFGEEECTMDFGDEENFPPAPSNAKPSGSVTGSSLSYATLQQRHLLACQFPGGEDFGKYLNDDGDSDVVGFNLPPADSENDSSSLQRRAETLSANLSGSEQPTATRRFRKRYETPSVATSPETTERQQSASPPPLPSPNKSHTSRPLDSTSPTVPGDYWSKNEMERDRFHGGRELTAIPSSLSSPQLNSFPQTSGGSAPYVGSSGTIERQKSASTIKEKFSRFLKLSSSSSSTAKRPSPMTGSRLRAASVVPEAGTIHSFSFADSKMAEAYLNRGGEPDSAHLETRSDFGGGYPSSSLARPGSTWWDVGTLSSARSVQMSDSSGSSMAGGTKSAKADKTRSPIPNFFRRNRRSKSVPDVHSIETSSALSNGSGSGHSTSTGGFSGLPRSPTRPASSSDKDVPPALPPMRKPSRDKDSSSTLSVSAADDRETNTGGRLKGMWKRITDGGSGPKGPAPSGEVPTLPRVEKVSTLRFSRTTDEVSIKL